MVYVRWYNQIVQGEVVENKTDNALLAGMVAVRIPIQGVHATALFTPGHVYDSPEQISEKSSINFQKSAEISKNLQEIAPKQQIIAVSDMMAEPDLNRIEAFKRDNWDEERGHLRIDKLDEFYQLWRMVMRPEGYKESINKLIGIWSQENSRYKPVEAEASVTLLSHKEKPLSAEAPKRIVSDERMEELKQELKEILTPKPAPLPSPKPASKKPSKKMLRSAGVQQFNDSTQLALFE